MRRWTLALFALAIGQACAVGAGPGPVFDIEALTSTPLKPRVLKSGEKDGIVTEEVMFHSEMDGDKSVDVFAFFVYPEGAKDLPAFIWNQGGCSMADTHMITQYGARRGYAAMCIDFPMPGYRSTGGYNIVSGLELTEDPRQAPIYHGAVALLKAVSYLQTRPEVDRDRIGMAGSSWGGFFTTLMVGLDPRLKAGAAMFGCGGLHLGNIWWDGWGQSGQYDQVHRERWRTTLDPAWALQGSWTPIAWFSGTNDNFYWMPALMETYRLARGRKHLSMLPNWEHGLTPVLDEHVFAWLDVHLKGEKGFVEVSPLEITRKDDRLEARWAHVGPRLVTTGEIMISYGDAGNWKSRVWQTLGAELDRNELFVRLPESPIPCYVSGTCVDEQGFRYSTPLVRVEPIDPGAQLVLDYDGCRMWGGFEKEHVAYTRGLAFMNPVVSEDAHTGDQCAVLKAGETKLFPIYYTPDVPHRFTCYMKAQKDVQLTVQLLEMLDGKKKARQEQFTVGDTWTEVGMDYVPQQALYGTLTAVVTVPEGETVLVDSVSFRPTPLRAE